VLPIALTRVECDATVVADNLADAVLNLLRSGTRASKSAVAEATFIQGDTL
jgi:hypothetical protein